VTPSHATAPTAAAGAPRPAEAPIRLMIVDDSQIARAVLSRMLASHKQFEVVALASNAGEALDTLKTTRVDIVLLDVEMPGTSGLDILPEILRHGAGAKVLIVSSHCEEGAAATVKALALGAADTLPKPGVGNFGGRFSDVLAERLLKIGGALPAPRPHSATPARDIAEFSLRPMPPWKLGCLALGASTGGLHAIGEFLRLLPKRVGAPILITQHLPPVFMPFFARQIEAASGRSSCVAEEGMTLQPEQVLIAPGEAHLGLERVGSAVKVRLSETPASSGCLPSVDPMLWAVSEAYGKSALAVIFSGMGRDGLVGSARIADRGGGVLAQDQRSSAVWGMPRAVAEAGLACAVAGPAELARRVASRIEGAPWK
jgi:two-component system chemotaxis response regulator CheB